MVRRTASAVLVCLLAPPSSVLAEDVVDFAAKLIGRPYVWGAEGPKSFDCSGLTQYVYAEFGVRLPRRAIDQSDELRDKDTADLFTETSRGIDKWLWMVEAHLLER